MGKDLLERLTLENGAFSDVAREGHGYLAYPKLKGPLGPRMTFNGKEKIVWSLNDYLGLSTHPEVEKTEKEAAQHYSMSYPIGSRIMASNQE